MNRTTLAAALALMLTAGLLSLPGAAATDYLWTAIHTPAGPGQQYYEKFTTGMIPIAGTADPSLNGTSVNVYCFYQDSTHAVFEAALTVTNGVFSGKLSGDAMVPCTLRAVPQSISISSPNGVSVGSFAGPTMLSVRAIIEDDSDGKPVNYDVMISDRRGITELNGVYSGAVDGRALSDPESQAVTSQPDLLWRIETLTVDGHAALLPGQVNEYATSPSLVPPYTIRFSRAANGNATVRESSRLDYCTDPPNMPCTLAQTGVTFSRVYRTSLEGLRLSVRDTFSDSTRHSHALAIAYADQLNPYSGAAPGLAMPGAKIAPPPAMRTYPALPKGPHTIRVVSDIHAAQGTLDVADGGMTYSAAPKASIHSLELFLAYTRKVPAHGAATFSFIHSQAYSLTGLQPLTKSAETALRGEIHISSPKRNKLVHSSHVRVVGRVIDPANGLPSTVMVRTGHRHRRATVSRSGHFSTVLTLGKGRHRISVTAVDPGADPLHASVRLRRR
jgi:hypothetical protein